MKKKICMLCLVLVCLFVLAGCCDHVWLEANCTDPATCSECGETEGEALGHTWVDADCLNPKTCSVCGETEGEALGHDWVDATCAAPKTCSVCGETEGEALEHTWLDATTEAPMTCENCGATEGNRIITDIRFTTAACQHLFGTWQGEVVATAETLGLEGEGQVTMLVSITFNNNGEGEMTVTAADLEEYKAFLLPILVDVLYEQFKAQGYNKSQADELCKSFYGMTVEELAYASAAEIKEEDLSTSDSLVYYVDGELYWGSDWNSEMICVGGTVEGDSLLLNLELYGSVTMTKVEE